MTRTIITLVSVIAAGALFVLYTKPAYDGVQSIRTQIDEYNLALDKASELQRLKQSLLSRYNSFNPADIDRLHKLLPDHVDNVRLVLDLDTLASKHGLALQNVIISGASEATAEAEITTIGPAVQQYDSVSIQFGTIGNYDRFVQFITDLEKSLRVVDIVDLSMNNTNTPGGEPVYRFDITLKTYWLK